MISQPVFSIFPLLHCPLGLRELQACPFPYVVFPPLSLSALSSSPFYCALQDGFGQSWWTGDMSIAVCVSLQWSGGLRVVRFKTLTSNQIRTSSDVTTKTGQNRTVAKFQWNMYRHLQFFLSTRWCQWDSLWECGCGLAFSSRSRIWGEFSTIHSPSALKKKRLVRAH